MPAPGLSLFGFLPQVDATNYLNSLCMLGPTDDPAVMWTAAAAQLGAPIANAGNPEIIDMPAGHEAYLQGLQTTNPRFEDTIASLAWSFKMVEIDPLIAFQYHVFTDHSGTLCGVLTVGAPTVPELLSLCLPHNLDAIPIHVSGQPNGLILESESPNVRLLAAGLLGNDPAQRSLAGTLIGVSSPLVSVVRFNGRAYLRNGYHRVYGAKQAGATHVPCIFGDTNDWAQVGVGPGFFSQPLLVSANPPTMGHYTQGRAYELTLRRVRRVVSVSWSEFGIPER